MKHIILPAIILAIVIGNYAKPSIQNQEDGYVQVAIRVQNNGSEPQRRDNTDVSVGEAKPVVSATPEPKVMGEKTIRPDIAKMLDYIHLAESSRGKNTNPQALHNWCKSKGQSNEYGYGGMRLRICFESHQEAQDKITDWLERHLERFEGDEAKTLCWYNLGLEEVNCKYYQNYLGIKI